METTKAYFFSHILLRNKIYFDSKVFSEKLNSGPEVMKAYLLELWNSINESNFKDDVIIKDADKNVTVYEFDITHRTLDNIEIFFFILPDSEFYYAQAKVVAFVIDRSSNLIRYITMEVWSYNELENMKKIFGDSYEPKYTVGEWKYVDGRFNHLNYGRLENNTIECFASFISEKILSMKE